MTSTWMWNRAGHCGRASLAAWVYVSLGVLGLGCGASAQIPDDDAGTGVDAALWADSKQPADRASADRREIDGKQADGGPRPTDGRPPADRQTPDDARPVVDAHADGKPMADVRRPDGRTADTRRPDGARADAGRPDARRPDMRRPDARLPDARRPDALLPDVRRTDLRLRPDAAPPGPVELARGVLTLVGLSGDGQQAAFLADLGSAGGTLRVVPLSGGASTEVATGVCAARWMGSAGLVLYSACNSQTGVGRLALWSPALHTPRLLAARSMIGEDAVSPDGRTVVFTDLDAGGLALSGPDAKPRPLVAPILSASLRFIPDSSALVITHRAEETVPFTLELVNLPSGQRNLLATDAGESFDLSADGKRIAYLGDYSVGAGYGDLMVASLPSLGNPVLLDFLVYDLELLPQDRQIIYVDNMGGELRLRTVEIATEQATTLVASGVLGLGAVSSDGNYLVYPAESSADMALRLLPIASPGQSRLLAEGDAFSAAFSTDSRHLAFIPVDPSNPGLTQPLSLVQTAGSAAPTVVGNGCIFLSFDFTKAGRLLYVEDLDASGVGDLRALRPGQPLAALVAGQAHLFFDAVPAAETRVVFSSRASGGEGLFATTIP